MKTQFSIGDIVSHKNKRSYIGKVTACHPHNGTWYYTVTSFNGAVAIVREDLLLDVVGYMVNSERLELIEETARNVVEDHTRHEKHANHTIIALKHALEGKVR